jgi:hypothetical protein
VPQGLDADPTTSADNQAHKVPDSERQECPEECPCRQGCSQVTACTSLSAASLVVAPAPAPGIFSLAALSESFHAQAAVSSSRCAADGRHATGREILRAFCILLC